MRVYHNIKHVKRLARSARKQGYKRTFVQVNRTIPELRLYKDNIIEVDEYDAEKRTYSIYTGYGNIRLWKSACREIT